eukprot:444324-Rhodomonas_salina.3
MLVPEEAAGGAGGSMAFAAAGAGGSITLWSYALATVFSVLTSGMLLPGGLLLFVVGGSKPLPMVLCVCYAESGTDEGYDAARCGRVPGKEGRCEWKSNRRNGTAEEKGRIRISSYAFLAIILCLAAYHPMPFSLSSYAFLTIILHLSHYHPMPFSLSS